MRTLFLATIVTFLPSLIAGCNGGTNTVPDVADVATVNDTGASTDTVATDATDAVLPTDTAPSADAGANYLIADQWNNRIIEVTRAGQIVWTFGNGSTTAGPNSVVSPNDSERVGTMTLIAGTGAPPMSEPACTNATVGCPDSRVILVDATGHITWTYGQAGVSGAGANQLSGPTSARMLANGNVLITDQGNNRVIEVSMAGAIVWQYGTTGTSGADANQLNNPNSAERLANGNTLIADENNNRVIEVTPTVTIAWSYGTPSDTATLNGAAFASRLPNGNTLITDSGNNRAIEVSPAHAVVWMYTTNTRTGSIASTQVSRAIRLANGNTLISDQANNQVIEVDAQGHVAFSYGQIGVAGMAAGQLNWPYDAKLIGDFTGLTAPR